jgi:hypothetical protein
MQENPPSFGFQICVVFNFSQAMYFVYVVKEQMLGLVSVDSKRRFSYP